MKIIVPVKRVLDPDRAAGMSIAADGTGFDATGIAYKPNPFDEYAVETALRISEVAASPVEIVLVTVGAGEAEATLRQCMALGAQRAILVKVDERTLDPHVVATVLAAVVRRESPDVIITGKQAVDDDAGQVPQMLSEMLGWPGAMNASRIVVPSDGASATLHCPVDDGLLRVRVVFPAVISVDLRIVSPSGVQGEHTTAAFPDGPRFATLRQVMAARKKPVEVLEPDNLGISPAPRTTIVSAAVTPSSRNCIIFETIDALLFAMAEDKGLQ